MLRHALRLLRELHGALIDDVVDGKRMFWLGSGISKQQVPDLEEIIRKVLSFLRDQAATESQSTAHRDALIEILGTHLSDELARYESDPVRWVPRSTERLRNVYSDVLGTRVGSQPGDYLLMTAADLPNTYGADDLEPGLAHRLIAVLVIEGVLKEIASGNWDGLVEAAVSELTSVRGLLDVYVIADDLREGNSDARIVKFHGCAVRTRHNHEKYASAVIATRAQMSRFETAESFKHMREALEQRTIRYKSLFLGLSVQDGDLLNVFTRSASNHPWQWDADSPAYVFAEIGIGNSQRNVLENSYADEFTDNYAEIMSRSAFGTLAEPLLAALVLEVLARKLLAMLGTNRTIDSRFENELAIGIRRLKSVVAASVGDDERGLLSFVSGWYAALVRQFLGIDSTHGYVPLFRGHRGQICSDPNLTVIGADMLAAAIGLLGNGELRHRWRIRTSRRQSSGNLLVVDLTTGEETQLSIVRGAHEADAILASKEWSSSATRIAILYAYDRPSPTARSLASRLGSARRVSNRVEVSCVELFERAMSVDEIAERLQTVVSL